MSFVFVSGADIGAKLERLDATLRRLWDVRQCVRPYRRLLVAAFALVLMSALLSLASSQFMRLLLDVALPRRDAAILAAVAAGLFAVPLVRYVVDLGMSYCSTAVAAR